MIHKTTLFYGGNPIVVDLGMDTNAVVAISPGGWTLWLTVYVGTFDLPDKLWLTDYVDTFDMVNELKLHDTFHSP